MEHNTLKNFFKHKWNLKPDCLKQVSYPKLREFSAHENILHIFP